MYVDMIYGSCNNNIIYYQMSFMEPPVTNLQVYSVGLRGTGHRYPVLMEYAFLWGEGGVGMVALGLGKTSLFSNKHNTFGNHCHLSY